MKGLERRGWSWMNARAPLVEGESTRELNSASLVLTLASRCEPLESLKGRLLLTGKDCGQKPVGTVYQDMVER